MRLDLLTLVACGLLLSACSPANGGARQYHPGEAEEDYEEDDYVGQGGTKTGTKGKGGTAGKGGKGGSSTTHTGGSAGKGGSGGNPSSGGAPNAGGADVGGSPGVGGDTGEGGSPGAGGQEPAGSGGDPGTGGTGGTGGGGSNCTYPSGGFGTSTGEVVSSSVSWNGYAPGASSPATISVQDFFDCDGTKGVNAVLIIYGAGWCSACQEEAANLPSMMQSWGPQGIVVVELLVETAGGSPATAQTAKQWRDTFNLENGYVAADPSFQLESPVADSFPYKVIVDPRTMTIVSTYTGGSDDEVVQLALKNK